MRHVPPRMEEEGLCLQVPGLEVPGMESVVKKSYYQKDRR